MRKINFLKTENKHHIGIVLVGALILYSLVLVIYSSILVGKVNALKSDLKTAEENLTETTELFESRLEHKDFLIKDYKEKNDLLLEMLDDATETSTPKEVVEETTTEQAEISETDAGEIETSIEDNNPAIEPTSEVTESEIIEVEEPVYEEVLWDESYIVQLTESERRDFAALIMLESQGESMECKKAVASVVINRMRINGLSLREVLYADNQFEPAPYISSTEGNADCYEAVDYVCAYGPTIPLYVTYFATYYFGFAIPYTVIDHTYFSYSPYIYNTVMGNA